MMYIEILKKTKYFVINLHAQKQDQGNMAWPKYKLWLVDAGREVVHCCDELLSSPRGGLQRRFRLFLQKQSK